MRRVRRGLEAALAATALLALGCGRMAPSEGRVVAVSQQDLIIDVEVSGVLRSLESDSVGPPSGITDAWEFKIIRLANEGSRIEAGAEAVAFDTTELERRLSEYESQAKSDSEELARARSEQSLSQLSGRLTLEEAEAKKRKAELKAEKPAELAGLIELKVLGIERDLARREVDFQRDREKARVAQSGSELAVLEAKLARARGRVAEIKAEIAAMVVKARRPGTVIYKQNWRGEKKKVGDSIWRAETVLEIAALDRMAATGQVDEVDASYVAVGQRVGLRLEAHPEKEYGGAVERVASLVQTESPESRVKVVGLELKLLETDALLMRPGMRFRGRIEVARLPGVLQIPLAAVTATAQGAQVQRVDKGGSSTVTAVKLGRRSREAVEVLSGLLAGDQVLVRSTASAAASGNQPFRMGAS